MSNIEILISSLEGEPLIQTKEDIEYFYKTCNDKGLSFEESEDCLKFIQECLDLYQV